MEKFTSGPGLPARDDYLPLDVEQAAVLRRLVRDHVAARGLEVVVEGDHVRDPTGERLDLRNLASHCALRPGEDWSAMVDQSLTSFLDRPDSSDLTEEELRKGVRFHLLPVERVRGTGVPYMPIGEDLAAVLGVDHPDHLITPSFHFWDERGGFDHWLPIGQANLRTEVHDPELEVRQHHPEGVARPVTVAGGSSYYLSATALELDAVIDVLAPGTDLSAGALVVVPSNRHFAFSAVVRGQEHVSVINYLLYLAGGIFRDLPDPLSPHVYLVRRGEWHALTRPGESGAVTLDLPDEDAAVSLGLDET